MNSKFTIDSIFTMSGSLGLSKLLKYGGMAMLTFTKPKWAPVAFGAASRETPAWEIERLFSCDPTDHPGFKSPKSLEKSPFGQRSPRKSPNRLKMPEEVQILVFFRYLRLFRVFSGTFCRPPKKLFSRLVWDFGPEGPETLVNGRSGRNYLGQRRGFSRPRKQKTLSYYARANVSAEWNRGGFFWWLWRILRWIFRPRRKDFATDFVADFFVLLTNFVWNFRLSMLNMTGRVRPRQGTDWEICNFGEPSPLAFLNFVQWDFFLFLQVLTTKMWRKWPEFHVERKRRILSSLVVMVFSVLTTWLDDHHKAGKMNVSTSTVVALFSKMALTGHKIAMVDVVLLPACPYVP